MYTSVIGSLSCEYCKTPYTSLKVGESACDAYYLNVDIPAVGGIAGLFMFIFFTCLFTLRKPAKIILTFAIILVPAMDFILDFLYILSVQFVNEGLFDASLFVFLFSLAFQLGRSISRKDVSLYSYLHTMFPIRQKTIILDYNSGSRKLTVHRGGDSKSRDIPVCSCDALGMCCLRAFQCLTWSIWYVALCVPYTPWLLLGAILGQLQLLAIGAVRNFWFSVWTYSYRFDVDWDIHTVVLNKSVQNQFLSSSLFQLGIQLYNSLRLRDITGKVNAVAVMSPVLSTLMIMNVLCRFYLYAVIYKGYAFDDISFVLATKIDAQTVRDQKLSDANGSSLGTPLEISSGKEVHNAIHLSLTSKGGGAVVLRELDSSSANVDTLKVETAVQKEEIQTLQRQVDNLKTALDAQDGNQDNAL